MPYAYFVVVKSPHEIGSYFPRGMICERFSTYKVASKILSQFLKGFVDVDMVLT